MYVVSPFFCNFLYNRYRPHPETFCSSVYLWLWLLPLTLLLFEIIFHGSIVSFLVLHFLGLFWFQSLYVPTSMKRILLGGWWPLILLRLLGCSCSSAFSTLFSVHHLDSASSPMRSFLNISHLILSSLDYLHESLLYCSCRILPVF